MIKSTNDGNPSPGLRPVAVVLTSTQLSISQLPAALPFQIMEVACWETVFRKLSAFRPGCVMVDFDHQRDENLAAVRQYADQGVRFSIVGVTADRSRKTLQQALRNGFVDLVPRPLDHRDVSEAVEDAFQIDSQGIDSRCELRSCYGCLTPKEREVLPHLLLGVPSRRLAGQFAVTYQTIDRHRKHVIEKMKVGNMTELAMKLYRQN